MKLSRILLCGCCLACVQTSPLLIFPEGGGHLYTGQVLLRFFFLLSRPFDFLYILCKITRSVSTIEAALRVIYVRANSEFQNRSFHVFRRNPAPVSVNFYCCICAFLCRAGSFNLSLCRFWPFQLSYVAVSNLCCLQ